MPHINYSVIADHKLSDNAFATLLVIRHLTNFKTSGQYYLSIPQIYHFLTGSMNMKQIVRIQFQKAIKELVNSDYVDGELSGNNIILINSTYFDETKSWTFVKPEWIQQVYSLGERSKSSALRYYCLLLASRWNYEGKYIGHWSIFKLADVLGKTPSTISRYNKLLEGGKAIFVFRTYDRETCNYYGLYDDRAIIYDFAMSQRTDRIYKVAT